MNDFIAVYPVTIKDAVRQQVAQDREFFSTAQLLSISDYGDGLCGLETLEHPHTITISARFEAMAAAFGRKRIPVLTLRGKVGNPFFEMTDVLLLPQNYNAPELNGDGYTRLTARPTAAFEIRTNDVARRALTVYTLTRPREIQDQINVALLSARVLDTPKAEDFVARLKQVNTVHLPPVSSQKSQRF
jgi:hypothetical protein